MADVVVGGSVDSSSKMAEFFFARRWNIGKRIQAP